MSAIQQITALHAEASAILRPLGRAPTRSEYASALELADAALELATAAQLGEEEVSRCYAFQRFCYDPLLRCYARATGVHERAVYEKRSSRSAGSAASSSSRRDARLFDVDAGEHLVEALDAVHLSELLDEQEREESRRIRWSDRM